MLIERFDAFLLFLQKFHNRLLVTRQPLITTIVKNVTLIEERICSLVDGFISKPQFLPIPVPKQQQLILNAIDLNTDPIPLALQKQLFLNIDIEVPVLSHNQSNFLSVYAHSIAA